MKYFEQSVRLVKEKPALLLVLFGFFFIVLYGWYYAASAPLYNSPDETANAVFIEQYRQEQNFLFPTSSIESEYISSRSVQRRGDVYVPTGFLGLPLIYGSLARALGSWILPFLTPLFAVAGVIAFFFLLKRVFSQRVALLSSVFLLFLPQWWHFAAKGFLPNVPFFACLLIGMACLVESDQHQKSQLQFVFGFLGGLFAASALSIRPAEIWWVAFVFVVLAVAYRSHFRFTTLFPASLGGLAVFFFWMPAQLQTYGAIFTSGYGGAAEAVSSVSQADNASVLFPFGVNLLAVSQNVFSFVFKLFWWQSLLIAVGLIYLLKQPLSKDQRVYLLLFGMLSAYLFLLYGSWNIQDDLDPNRVSIGVSYVRYWLPIFVAAVPLMVIALQRLSRQFFTRCSWAFPAIFLVCLSAHVVFVYAAGDDNLSALRENTVNYRELRTLAEQLPAGAIIMSERMDKVFWPAREVINLSGTSFELLDSERLKTQDLYWFTILPKEHIRVLEQREFLPRGYTLEERFTHDYGTMYQLSLRL